MHSYLHCTALLLLLPHILHLHLLILLLLYLICFVDHQLAVRSGMRSERGQESMSIRPGCLNHVAAATTVFVGSSWAL